MKANRLLWALGVGLSLLLAACGGQTAGGGSGGSGGGGGGGGGGSSPSFILALNPTSLTVQQGSSGTTTLTVTPQNGFTGTVNLSLVAGQDQVPQGLNLSPRSVQVSGANPVPQTLTLSASTSTPTGTYRLKVRGTAQNITKDVDLTVTVSAPSGGGGGGGGSGGNTVTVRQLDTGPLVGAYYRTGSGSWQALSFSGGQATFTASGDYEVAVRCQAGPGVYTEVYLFKATASQATFSFICEIPRSVNSQTFEVTLPTTIGSYMVQSGDTVLIGPFSGGYTGSNPVSVNTQLPEGQQDVLVTVLRETGGTAPSITPIGYKLVTGLNVQGSGPFTVNATDWHPFVATRSITFNPPSGYQGLAGVLFSNNNMKVATYVGKIDRYGILSLPGTGKYLGLALAWDSSNQLFTLEETGGNDWTPSLPSPWGAGQFSVNGDELTLSYPGAPGYHIFASGLLKDSTSGNDLRTQITVVYSSGDTTTYTLPVVPGLNYALADPATRVVNLTLTVFRNGIGQNVSWAQRNVSFTGSSYTLP